MPEQAQDGTVVLSVPDVGLEINTFKSYEFNSNFITPTDGWNFVVGNDILTDNLIKILTPGTRVSLSINGRTQGDGLIDGVDLSSSRKAGTELHVHGRDRLAQVVDSCADPKTRLTAGMTIFDAVKTFFTPFGWSDDTQFLVNNATNRNVMTGATRGTPTTKKGKPLKSYVLHQTKPYPAEGTFAFLSRLSQRFGLWIWLTADGQFVVLSKPDFEQEAIYSIRHRRGPEEIYNNALTVHSATNYADQPSCIIATAGGTGGENAVGNFSLGVVNPAIDADNAVVINAYPNTRFIAWPDSPWISAPVKFPFARPLFLHDDESKTFDELEGFLRREISLRARRTLTYTVEVEGHAVSKSTGAVNDADSLIWAVDTIANVEDDVADIHEPLWIMGRTFIKSREGGTKTRLEMIRPHTLEF